MDSASADKQFVFTGTTHRYVDFDGTKTLMADPGSVGLSMPTPYSTLPMNAMFEQVKPLIFFQNRKFEVKNAFNNDFPVF